MNHEQQPADAPLLLFNDAALFPGLRRLSAKHQLFVTQMILHGNQRLAYKAAYCNANNHAADNGASRLMHDNAITARIDMGIVLAQRQKEQLRKEYCKTNIAAITEKRQLLASIMRGEIQQEEIITKKGNAIIKQKQGPAQRLRAIIIDGNLAKEIEQLL